MLLRESILGVRSRWHDSLSWISVAIFGGLFGFSEISSLLGAGFQGPRVWLAGGACPLLSAAGYGFLSALPWQWSGDDRPLAGHLRGCLQGLGFAVAFFLLLHYLDRALLLGLLGRGRAWHFGGPTLFPYLFQAPIMVLVGLFIAQSERGDQQKRQAESRLKEAQWVLLRTQLSPHVLFNTLNALAELARRDPEATERAMLDLSELYERMLHHGEQLLAPLAEERKILECYLALQALRLGDRLQVEWAWDSDLDALLAPPLMLQPLVENALKHGIAPQSGPGRMIIRATRVGASVRLEVRNTGQPPGSTRPGAVGLRNLNERLALAYGGAARLRLDREGEWTVASLTLPEFPWKS